MALTCNVKTVCRRLLNPVVWPVDPIRVGSRLNPPKLVARQCARGAGSNGWPGWPAGPEQRKLFYSRYIGTAPPGGLGFIQARGTSPRRCRSAVHTVVYMLCSLPYQPKAIGDILHLCQELRGHRFEYGSLQLDVHHSFSNMF